MRAAPLSRISLAVTLLAAASLGFAAARVFDELDGLTPEDGPSGPGGIYRVDLTTGSVLRWAWADAGPDVHDMAAGFEDRDVMGSMQVVGCAQTRNAAADDGDFHDASGQRCGTLRSLPTS